MAGLWNRSNLNQSVTNQTEKNELRTEGRKKGMELKKRRPTGWVRGRKEIEVKKNA